MAYRRISVLGVGRGGGGDGVSAYRRLVGGKGIGVSAYRRIGVLACRGAGGNGVSAH